MPFKNKKEREEFLENYREWELWKEIPELEVKLYRYAFISTGAVIIATEYPSMKFAGYSAGVMEYTKGTDVNYSLILRKEEKFKSQYSYSDNDYIFYKPSGERKSAIIEYLTKVKPEV